MRGTGSRCSGSGSSSTWIQSSWLTGSVALRHMWDLSRAVIEPVSPALAGRCPTTEPPGKPSFHVSCRTLNCPLSLFVLIAQLKGASSFVLFPVCPGLTRLLLLFVVIAQSLSSV